MRIALTKEGFEKILSEYSDAHEVELGRAVAFMREVGSVEMTESAKILEEIIKYKKTATW